MKKMIVLLMLVGLAGCMGKKTNQEQHVLATLWVQTAAEFRALRYQAFNFAKLRIDMDKMAYTKGKPGAVVLDIDETIIDNSPYQAKNIIKDMNYSSDDWKIWVNQARAGAVEGALDFVQYAVDNGYEIFYVSNRKVRGIEPTIKNLKALGFPVKRENMFFREKSSNKEPRRALIRRKYRIALLVGDALGDFSDMFGKKSVGERFELTDRQRSKFGTKWIMLPNPMYGAWEGAVYGYNFKLNKEQKDLARKKLLRGM